MKNYKRIAVLFFGQPRINPEKNFNLISLNNYINHTQVDVFMHVWFLKDPLTERYDKSTWFTGCCLDRHDITREFLLKEYKPTCYKFENQKYFPPAEYLHPLSLSEVDHPDEYNVANALSQIYSISEVCKLITHPEKYDTFILLRFDCEIHHDLFPPIEKLFPEDRVYDDESVMYTVQDYIQVFKHNILEIYKKQFDSLRIVKYSRDDGFFDAERLRSFLITSPIVELNRYSCGLLRRFPPCDDSKLLLIKNIRRFGVSTAPSCSREHDCACVINYGAIVIDDIGLYGRGLNFRMGNYLFRSWKTAASSEIPKIVGLDGCIPGEQISWNQRVKQRPDLLERCDGDCWYPVTKCADSDGFVVVIDFKEHSHEEEIEIEIMILK